MSWPPEKPDELIERFNAELARISTAFHTSPNSRGRSYVDLANAQLFMAHAVREAWYAGGAHQEARRRDPIVIHLSQPNPEQNTLEDPK